MKTLDKIISGTAKIMTGVVVAGALLSMPIKAQTMPDSTSKLLHTRYFGRDWDSRQLVIGSFDGTKDKVIYEDVNGAVAIKVSPDGSKVATVNKKDELVIIDIKDAPGKKIYDEYAGVAAGQDLTWENDTKLYFGYYTPGIYECMPPGYPQKIISTPGFRYFHNPTPNPIDTTMLSVLHEWSTRYFLYLSGKDGSGLKKIFSCTSTSERNEQLDLSWIDKDNFIFKNGRVDTLYYMNAQSGEYKAYYPGHPFNNLELSPNKELCALFGDTHLSIFETSQLGEDKITPKKNLRVYDPRDFAWARDSKHYAIIDYKYDKTVNIRVYDTSGEEYYFPNDPNITPLSISWNGIAPKDLALLTDVDEQEDIPLEFKLMNAYPNPINPSTTISYELANESDVNIAIYSVLGQKVRNITNENQSPGMHKHNVNLEGEATGAYFLKIDVENKQGKQTATQKLLLMK